MKNEHYHEQHVKESRILSKAKRAMNPYQIIKQTQEKDTQMLTETEKEENRIQLKIAVDTIVKEISTGIEITQENIEKWNDNGQYKIGDKVSGFDYIKDALDIEYRISNRMDYRTAEILVRWCVPIVRIDTAYKRVIGESNGDYYECSYNHDIIGIDDACKEMFLKCLP